MIELAGHIATLPEPASRLPSDLADEVARVQRATDEPAAGGRTEEPPPDGKAVTQEGHLNSTNIISLPPRSGQSTVATFSSGSQTPLPAPLPPPHHHRVLPPIMLDRPSAAHTGWHPRPTYIPPYFQHHPVQHLASTRPPPHARPPPPPPSRVSVRNYRASSAHPLRATHGPVPDRQTYGYYPVYPPGLPLALSRPPSTPLRSVVEESGGYHSQPHYAPSRASSTERRQ